MSDGEALQGQIGDAEFFDRLYLGLECLALGDPSELREFEGRLFQNPRHQNIWSQLARVRVRLQGAIVQNRSIARGNYSVRGESAGRSDKLFASYQVIHTVHRDMSQVLQRVVEGDYKQRVRVSGQGAYIGPMINQLVQRQRDIVAHLQRLISGDLSREFYAQGPKDVMGQVINDLGMVLREVAQTMKAVAQGDYSEEPVLKDEQDEIGVAMHQLIQSLRASVEQANTIAVGDFRSFFAPKSEKDQIGMALYKMSNALREVIQQLGLIAAGDVDFEPVVLGPNDQIGEALQAVIGSLRESAKVAMAVAMGDLNQRLPIKGNSDRMAEAFNLMVDNFSDVVAQAELIAAGDYSAVIRPMNEGDHLRTAMAYMMQRLREVDAENELERWYKTGQSELSDTMRGVETGTGLSSDIITFLAKYLGAQVGRIFVLDSNELLEHQGSYSLPAPNVDTLYIELGEGLVGQVALERERLVLSNIPPGQMRISTGFGVVEPKELVISPIVLHDELVGVISLASLIGFSERELNFLDIVSESIAISIRSVQDRMVVQELLEATQVQAAELQNQQAQLQVANADLADKNKDIEWQNQEITLAKAAIEEKAAQVEQASQYKSQFLANMSHELRTPLNSLLILARLLSENEDGNLSKEEVEAAQIIWTGGQDLLQIINDILDLSKVEAGMMIIELGQVSVAEIVQNLKRQFQPSATDKGLEFRVTVDDDVAEWVYTDRLRIEQVIKNLLSNAFKFTAKGHVELRVHRPIAGLRFQAEGLTVRNAIGFSVRDTGVGIPANKLKAVFEAFQQVDGSITRNYGGTGLGLSICREFSVRLGGEIMVESTLGQGSTFSFFVPESSEPVGAPLEEAEAVSVIEGPSLGIEVELGTVLIVEDDSTFGPILQRLIMRRGYECLWARTGKEAKKMVEGFKPDAVILDLGLPDMNGLELIAYLQEEEHTSDIPVHILSGRDDDQHWHGTGAIGYLRKTGSLEDIDKVLDLLSNAVASNSGQVLLISPQRENIHSFELDLREFGVSTVYCETAKTARERMERSSFSLIIFDTAIGTEGADIFLSAVDAGRAECSVLIYESGAVEPALRTALMSVSEHFVDLDHVESEALSQTLEGYLTSATVPLGSSKPPSSPECLSAVVSPELLAPSSLETPAAPIAAVASVAVSDTIDDYRTSARLLLVDDDMRNTFALARILRKPGFQVVMADNGQLAIDKLVNEGPFDIVVMDIMMPIMDGYEAMRTIRSLGGFESLPILALTANAIQATRDRCISAGANEFMTKPVEARAFLSVLRSMLSEGEE